MRKRGRQGGRIETDFTGPYTIQEVIGKIVKLAASDEKTLQKKISLDHIKPFRRSLDTSALTVQKEEKSPENIDNSPPCPKRHGSNTVEMPFPGEDIWIHPFIHKSHWIMLIVRKSQSELLLMDPLCGKDYYTSILKLNWSVFLLRYAMEEEENQWEVKKMKHMKQKVSSSCGTLILMFAKHFLLNIPVTFVETSSEFIKKARMDIASSLLLYSMEKIGTRISWT